MATAQQIAAAELRDPEVLREHERTALAHVVAMRLIRYRTDHGLSQTALARQLVMHQTVIARLEAGAYEPSLATLARLARGIGIDFSIEITPQAFGFRDTA
ncbi:MAG: helix-turn-helix domain-containing protein [Pseudonocardiaceae bacterium]